MIKECHPLVRSADEIGKLIAISKLSDQVVMLNVYEMYYVLNNLTMERKLDFSNEYYSNTASFHDFELKDEIYLNAEPTFQTARNTGLLFCFNPKIPLEEIYNAAIDIQHYGERKWHRRSFGTNQGIHLKETERLLNSVPWKDRLNLSAERICTEFWRDLEIEYRHPRSPRRENVTAN